MASLPVETIPAQALKPAIGSDLTLIGLSGEVVVDYVSMIEKALGPNQLWIAAYCNDVYGYLPSARVIAEGGYETRGLYSGGAGFFDLTKIRETGVRLLAAGVSKKEAVQLLTELFDMPRNVAYEIVNE